MPHGGIIFANQSFQLIEIQHYWFHICKCTDYSQVYRNDSEMKRKMFDQLEFNSFLYKSLCRTLYYIFLTRIIVKIPYETWTNTIPTNGLKTVMLNMYAFPLMPRFAETAESGDCRRRRTVERIKKRRERRKEKRKRKMRRCTTRDATLKFACVARFFAGI